MRWSSLKLWQKISIGIGSVLLLLLVTSLWAISGLTEVVKDGQAVITGNALRGELLQREVDHLNWVKNVSVFLLDDHVGELTVELDHTQCGFGKWYYGDGRRLAETIIPALKEPLAEIEEPHRKLHESAANIKKICLKTANGVEGRREAEAIFSQQTQPNLKKVQDELAAMNEISRKNILSEQGMLKRAMETRIVTIVISIAAVLVGGLVGWLITRSITRPVVRGVEFARAVAAGDLNQFIRVETQDEMGDLFNAMNLMAANLKELVGRIRDTSLQLASASDEIASGSAQLARAAREQSSASEETSSTMVQMSASIQTVAKNADSLAGNADEVSSSLQELGTTSEQVAKSAEVMASSVSETSATIEQMTVSIEKVAQNSEELAASVSETSSTVEQMTVSIEQVAGNSQELQKVVTETVATVEQMAVSISQTADRVAEADAVAKTAAREGSAGQQAIQETLAAMKRVAEVSEKTAASIITLGKRSEEIGNIVKVINEIADQTNLLALNAAIEAARAGDAGRGFAVVAEEVRKLAERSVTATREIGQVIKQVQADTSDSVRYGELASREARASMDLSGIAGNALANIVKSIEQTSGLMSDVARMAAEQAAASTQVIRAVGKMSESTRMVAGAAREQAQGGRQIRTAIERMNGLTREVAGATREQAMGSRQIRIAVENMNGVTQQVSLATREQSLSARQIVTAISSMNTMTQQVANATSEQQRGGEMVVAAMENISGLARGNLSSVETLNKSALNLAQQADSLKSLVAQFAITNEPG
ncbi:MAG: methyl-accepting chemotaxis protein [Geobacteraceae bacterium]|nr:methyl-accepting chemotaxis protein [Geobacteraceae bacterium]